MTYIDVRVIRYIGYTCHTSSKPMATSWPLIEAMRRCAYVPFYDTDGDVIKCNCCQQEEEELTKKDVQEYWGDAYECVHCKSYICPECWNTGYSDVPGTPDRDHNQSKQRAYISFAFADMQWHGGDRNWGQWNFCSKSSAAPLVSCGMQDQHYGQGLLEQRSIYHLQAQYTKMRLSTHLFSKREHPVWDFLYQNFDTLLKPHFIEPQRPLLPGPPAHPVPEI